MNSTDLDARVSEAVRSLTDRAPRPPSPATIASRRERHRQRRRRRSARAVVALSAGAAAIVAFLVVVPGVGPLPAPGLGDRVGPRIATVRAQADLQVAVDRLPPGPLSLREDATAVWTGREFIVWGGGQGDQGGGGVLGDGAAYDPAEGTWRPLAPAPIGDRMRHEAVWTGDRMLVWGGAGELFGGQGLADGAAYDPVADTWTPLPAGPRASATVQGRAVWAAGRLVVSGGGDGAERIAVLDPAAGRWTVHTLPGPVVGLVAAGDDVAALISDQPADAATAVAWFDPIAGEVAATAVLPGISQPDRLGITWTGQDAVVAATSTDQQAIVASFPPRAPEARSVARVVPGDALHPAFWFMTYQETAQVWTGQEVLMASDYGVEVYRPATGEVARTSEQAAEALSDVHCGIGAASAWAGERLLSWGGQGCRADGPGQLGTGVAVRLLDDTGG